MKCPLDNNECPTERTISSPDGDPNCLGIQASVLDIVESEILNPTFKTNKYLDFDLMPKCPRYNSKKANKILKERLEKHNIGLNPNIDEIFSEGKK